MGDMGSQFHMGIPNNKQTTTNNADELRQKVIDIFMGDWMDYESLRDGDKEDIDAVMELFAQNQNQLLREILEELPESLSKPKLRKLYADEKIDWVKYCEELSHTNTVKQITATIKSKMRGNDA